MKNIVSIFVLFFFGISSFYGQGYEISVKFNVHNDTLILGHHRANQLIPDDTIVTDQSGKAVFTGEDRLPGGMYFLFFPNKRYFDFLVGENQKFSISGDTANFSGVSFKGDRQNQVFSDYQKEMRRLSLKMQELQQEKATAEDKAAVDAEILAAREELEALFNRTIQENEDLFFSDFLKATRDPQVPPSITDNSERYRYYRNHYFDNFDYSDDRLMRTPIYENKIETYLDKLLPQLPDTLIEAADMFVEASRGDDEHFKYMLIYLFNKYASSQLMAAENVHVHLAEKYYIPEAHWSDRKFIEDLKGKVAKKKRCLVGAKAHDIDYRKLPNDLEKIKRLSIIADEYKEKGLAAETNLSESAAQNKKVELLSRWVEEQTQKGSSNALEAKFTIIWFWTPDCSHCRTATPKFHDAYVEKNLKEQGVEIIALYLNEDIKDWKNFTKEQKRWVDFIEEHKLTDWINAWNPFDAYRSNFDINSSPVLYVLDENKEILAKRIAYEQALEVIESELSKQ